MTERLGDFAKRLLAAIVLFIVAWFVLKAIINVATGIAWLVAAVVGVMAVLWAVRTLRR